MRTPAPGFSGIAHQEEQGPQGTVLRVRGGWFAKRKSCTGVEGLEVAKLPGHALLISSGARPQVCLWRAQGPGLCGFAPVEYPNPLDRGYAGS